MMSCSLGREGLLKCDYLWQEGGREYRSEGCYNTFILLNDDTESAELVDIEDIEGIEDENLLKFRLN